MYRGEARGAHDGPRRHHACAHHRLAHQRGAQRAYSSVLSGHRRLQCLLPTPESSHQKARAVPQSPLCLATPTRASGAARQCYLVAHRTHCSRSLPASAQSGAEIRPLWPSLGPMSCLLTTIMSHEWNYALGNCVHGYTRALFLWWTLLLRNAY